MFTRSLQGVGLHMCKTQGHLRKDIAYIWVAGKNLVHRAAEKKRPVSWALAIISLVTEALTCACTCACLVAVEDLITQHVSDG